MRDENGFATVALVVVVVLLGFAALFWLGPQYNIYSKTQNGKAMLQEAESTRQVRVYEAKAKKEAAVLEADAEVARAEGVAKANKIIGDSLKGNPEYLKYLYITGLQDQEGKQGEKTVVYIPTDGLVPLPISESGRVK
jgi:regulator of protease activity HflC (stomatin/prohibitin superfamily)